VQQRTRDDTHPQSQYCGTAPYSLRSRQCRQCTPKTRIAHRAYDAATIQVLHISTGPTRTSRTCRPAPRSPTITPQSRAHRHTRRDKPHPPQYHVSVMARVTHNLNSAHQQATHRTSHSHAQHTNTQAPHARTTSRTAATTAHCTNITARTPPHTRHTQHGTQLRAPHTSPTENHTQSHTPPPRRTHSRLFRLPSVDGMLPKSWLLFKLNCLQDTRTAIASHHGTRRRRRPQPAAGNASQCIA
jgi:hypothetical protein